MKSCFVNMGIDDTDSEKSVNYITIQIMRKLLLPVVFLSSLQISYGQTGGNETAPVLYNGAGALKMISGESNLLNASIATNGGLNISTNKRIEGTAFMHENWNNGYILFSNSGKVDSILVRYNILQKKLYFLDGEKQYYLNEYFKEFGYQYTENDITKKVVFRNGFPPIDKNDVKTNYQVLAGSDLILLKHITKEVQERTQLDGQTYIKVADEETYYVYNTVDQSIKKLRKGTAQIQSDFPQFKNQIETISEQDGLRGKSETDLVKLFEKLNSGREQNKPESKKPF